MTKVSVIIPTYNCARYLPEAIDSVLTQTCQDFELIIIDDGSTDNTNSIAKDFAKANPSFLIRYIHQNNAGPSAARNRGIKESKGEYIAFLDSDDIWEHDKLAKQIECMQNNDLKGLCCTDYNSEDETNIVTGTHRLSCRSKNEVLRALLIKTVIACPTVMVNRECFNDIGLFDESLHVAEDRDMWIRIIRKFDFSHIPEPLVKVRIRKESQSSDGNKNLQNDLFFLNKLFSDPEFKNKHLTKAKAYSTRYLSAAIAYRENDKLSDMRACAFKAGMLYPPHIFTKKFLGLMKDTIILKFKKTIVSPFLKLKH